jgi:hypothetical protein
MKRRCISPGAQKGGLALLALAAIALAAAQAPEAVRYYKIESM